MVFFSILAIRPRVAGVHIPSLNHGRKPHSTPFQTDSKVTPSARPPTKQGGRRRTDTLNKRSCVGERRQIRQGRRLSPLLTVIVWRVTSGERLDEPWIDYQRKAVVEAPHRAMGSFGVPAPDASMPRVEQRASLWAQYVLYVLLFVTTLLGWAGTNPYGDPVSIFGLFDFPAIIAVRPHFRLASHLRDFDRCDRRAPCRGRALPLACQRRSRSTARSAGELSVNRLQNCPLIPQIIQ